MCIGFVFKLKRNKSLAQSFNGSAKLQMVIKGSAKVFCFNPKVVLTEKSYASKIYYYQPKKKKKLWKRPVKLLQNPQIPLFKEKSEKLRPTTHLTFYLGCYIGS